MTTSLPALVPFRDRVLVLSGLDNRTSMAQPGEGGAHHTRASATYLTGVHPKATDGVDIRASSRLNELPGVGVQGFQIATLSFVEQDVEGQC